MEHEYQYLPPPVEAPLVHEVKLLLTEQERLDLIKVIRAGIAGNRHMYHSTAEVFLHALQA